MKMRVSVPERMISRNLTALVTLDTVFPHTLHHTQDNWGTVQF